VCDPCPIIRILISSWGLHFMTLVSLKFHFSDTIALKIRVSIYEFVGEKIQSITQYEIIL
jgi:hypothetical protein